jgi:hypothetical protein
LLMWLRLIVCHPKKKLSVPLQNHLKLLLFILKTDRSMFQGEKRVIQDLRMLDCKLEVKIEIIGHTHAFRDEGSEEKSMFYSSLPSAADLTSRGAGADHEYIFNTFGRIAFSAMDNLGPQPEDGMGANSISQSIVNSAMRVAAKEARQQGIKEVPKIINYLGEYMERMFGVGFKYESWDEVGDPFSL